MKNKEIVITSACRTAVGSIGKSLKNVSASSLGASVISESIKKINVDKTKRSHQMTCYNCNGELIWGGDHDIEEEFDHEDAHSMSTNLSCKDCGTFVIVYTPKSFLKGKTE